MNQTPAPVQQVVVNVQNSSNGLGLAGLIFSVLGWPTCGLLCIPGALLSFLGLFNKPRGTAIAGLIIGFPGVIFFVFWGMALIGGLTGIGVVASGAVDQAREAARKQQAEVDAKSMLPPIEEPSVVLDANSNPTDTNPTDPGDSAIAATIPVELEPQPQQPSITKVDEPVAAIEPEMPMEKPDPRVTTRTFSDASGKFKVEAKVTGYKGGFVQLERADNGKTISIEVKKLSENDQQWLKDSFGE